MKKTIAILLTLCLVFALASCAAKSSTASTTSAAASQSTAASTPASASSVSSSAAAPATSSAATSSATSSDGSFGNIENGVPTDPTVAPKDLKVAVVMEIFDIQPRNSSATLFGKFSGGNQQKAIMAKWLCTCPKVFVLDDPTYGVDPASRIRIFTAMREAAASNVAMIVFSTEPEQLAGLCSRVLALHNGQIVAELKESDGTLDRNSIAKWCYTWRERSDGSTSTVSMPALAILSSLDGSLSSATTRPAQEW